MHKRYRINILLHQPIISTSQHQLRFGFIISAYLFLLPFFWAFIFLPLFPSSIAHTFFFFQLSTRNSHVLIFLSAECWQREWVTKVEPFIARYLFQLTSPSLRYTLSPFSPFFFS
uniref:Uncharacterized protein n=1 Tax=Opuntia streptacantha TaxID=393608 RepID=A0A7C8Z7G7_OPUST